MTDTNLDFHAWWASVALPGNVITENTVLEAYIAARNAALEEAAKVADTEAQKRHANYLACKAGSQAWGYDPKTSAMAQGHKEVTAILIAAAIRELKGK
jgi:hypothetical protein